MLRIVSIIITEQLKHFFRKEQLWLRLLATVGITLLTAIYSVGFAFLLREVGTEITSEFGLSVAEIVMIIVGALGALTISAHFFPTYQPKKLWIPRVFPMSRFRRFTTEVSIDSLGLLYLGNIIFFLPPFFMADLFTWKLMLLVVFYTFLIQLTLRAFQTFFQDNIEWSNKMAYIGVALLLLAGGSVVPTALNYELFWWMPLLTAVLAYAGSYAVETTTVGQKEEQAKAGDLSFSYLKMGRDLIWNTKPIRTGMMISFLFKIIILAVAASGVLLDSENNSWLHYYLLFFALPPMSIFTYVYNNVFGYLRSSWLTIQKSTGDYKDFRALYNSLFATPILIDFLISTTFALYMQMDLVFFFGMYIGSTILNYMGGLFWSIYFPRPVLKSLSMKGGNTAPISNFFVMGIVGLTYTLKLSYWFLLLIPLYILSAFILNKIMVQDYGNKHYQLYDKLFKDS